jgi:hypothetical protein
LELTTVEPDEVFTDGYREWELMMANLDYCLDYDGQFGGYISLVDSSQSSVFPKRVSTFLLFFHKHSNLMN